MASVPGIVLGLALLTGAAARKTPAAVDLDGHPVVRLAASDTTAVVLFFAATDCPIANRYTPEIERLASLFHDRGVRFWFVYPNPSETAAIVRAHQQSFGIATPALLDVGHALVTLTHATVTPEAAILLPRPSGLQEVYLGRIDDRYVSFGRERPQATHHDLEAALRALLDGQAAPPPSGQPVGCSIVPLSR